jgi:dipeptidyl-peptidase-3
MRNLPEDTMRPTTVLATLLACGALFAQDPAAPAAQVTRDPALRVGELERLGENGREVMVLGLDAPGFEKLKPSQRKYAYFLYRAAIAGHDIFYQQSHRTALEIRNLLEAVWEKREGLDPAAAAGLEEYLKLVWIHHGQYDHWNHTKFTPRLLTFEQLKAAVQHAKKKGASFDLAKGETLDRKLARLKPHIFDPKVDPVQVNQTPGADPVATSAVGMYDPGLALKDIEALPKADQEKLNVRFGLVRDKKGKRTVEAQEFKVGGTYGEDLERVTYWLKKAAGYVDNVFLEVEKDGVKKLRSEPEPNQKAALDSLIAHLETGDEAQYKAHTVAWLKTKSAVDYLNGFVETYKDPRGIIGSYEANVSILADSEKIGKLSQNALYFEAKMPWDAKWKRAKVDPPVATVVNVLVATGDAGPVSPAAYNLPNYADVRKEHGSKNVVLLNVENSASAKVRQSRLEAFYRPEDRALAAKHGSLARQWLVYMHEVIGHGSGQADESLAGADPATRIGPTYSALEECRADLVALHQFLDPKVVEIGAVSAEEHLDAAHAMILGYLVDQFAANANHQGDTVREAHDRGRQLVLNYLLQPSRDFGVKMEEVEGRRWIAVTDLNKAHAGIGEILGKLQAFKSMGDKAGAEAFFAEFGTKVNPQWRDDAKARAEAMNLPKLRAFVFPQLVPVMGESRFAKEGDKRDVLSEVRLETREDLAEQMMRFKRWSKSREIAPK